MFIKALFEFPFSGEHVMSTILVVVEEDKN